MIEQITILALKATYTGLMFTLISFIVFEVGMFFLWLGR